MTSNNYIYFQDFFSSYVHRFNSKDKNIQENITLKKEHTYRVVEAIDEITSSLSLDVNSCLIAKTAALFHDIGRFEQFTKYQTYDDKISENHALLSIQVLETEKILDILEPNEKELILRAIKFHNVYELPLNESNECLMFCKLVRDADKVDIYKVLTDYYDHLDTDPNPAIEHYLPMTETYSRLIIENIINNNNFNSKLIKCRYDMRLFVLSWVFDINYSISLKLIRKRDYINKILKVLPDNEDLMNVRVAVNKYIDDKLTAK